MHRLLKQRMALLEWFADFEISPAVQERLAAFGLHTVLGDIDNYEGVPWHFTGLTENNQEMDIHLYRHGFRGADQMYAIYDELRRIREEVQ